MIPKFIGSRKSVFMKYIQKIIPQSNPFLQCENCTDKLCTVELKTRKTHHIYLFKLLEFVQSMAALNHFGEWFSI